MFLFCSKKIETMNCSDKQFPRTGFDRECQNDSLKCTPKYVESQQEGIGLEINKKNIKTKYSAKIVYANRENDTQKQ